MKGIIYKYTNKINSYSYIGQTTHENERIIQHKNCYGDFYFHRAIKKYGWDNFDYEVLFSIDDENIDEVREVLNEKEEYYIKLYDSFNNGYNMTLGGKGINMGKFSDEHKLKISIANKGKPKSEEHKRNLSISKKINYKKEKHPNFGKHLADETKNKISNTLKSKNYHLTEEHKQKLKDSHRKTKIEFYSKDVYQRDYESIKEAANDLGITTNKISNILQGLVKCGKTKEGYSFRYKRNEE